MNLYGDDDPFDFNTLSAPTTSGQPSTVLTDMEAGPQQTRKPAASISDTQPRPQTFDPRALLNPKAASASKSATSEADTNNGLNGVSYSDHGAAHLLENFHGLTSREDVPVAKRKITTSLHDESDDEDGRKKQKSQAKRGNAGIISEGLKEQRKKLAEESGPSSAPIDLTKDDDNDDVVFEGAQVVKQSPEEEVCLGVIDTSANAYRVPTAKSLSGVPKTLWPKIRVTYKRVPSQNHVIDLFDVANAKFGAMDIRAAAALSPLLDASGINKMRCMMHLTSRTRNNGEAAGMKISASLKMTVTIYAPRKHAQLIGKFLSQKQLFLRDPPEGNMKFNIVNPHNPQPFGPIRSAVQKSQTRPMSYMTRSVEEMRREANTMFDGLAKSEELGKMEPNTDVVRTKLMDHQKQGLSFMMEHERADFDEDEMPPSSLWRFKPKANGAPSWYHVITGLEVKEKPDPVQGGILADMMGLGKTLSIIALIAETKAAAKEFWRQKPDSDMELEYNARGTLIICPKSVLSNWNEQIGTHTVPGSLTVYNYHGTNRTRDTRTLSKYDVVLTSYNTAASEFSDTNKVRNALNSINWFRIVLDEAHSIRTQTTQVSKACCALYAERRWAVTGTPVQNSLTDLGALIKFLRIHPLDNLHAWTQHIMSPFKNGDVEVVQQLQLLVRSITLRRLKDKIDLSSRKEEIVELEFSEMERVLYTKFASVSRSQLNTITDGGNRLRGKAYAHVLKSIGRLRMISAHGRELLTEEDMKEIEDDDPNSAIVLDIGDEDGFDNPNEFVPDGQAYSLYKTMQDSEVDTCQCCSRRLGKKETAHITDSDDADSEDSYTETPEPDGDDFGGEQNVLGFLTPCYHLICTDCKEDYKGMCRMTTDFYYMCPHCSTYQRFGLKELTKYGLEHFLQERQKTGEARGSKWNEDTYSGPHTKVQYLLKGLENSQNETLPEGEPPIRSVVFSGWTTYLDLIGYALEKREIGYARLDGSMSVKARSKVIEDFQSDPRITVLLVSIKAGGQGLNFTAANKVYIMEPQFNPGVEQQAADRVHRLGQKRAVVIQHLIMKDSIEEKILELQKKKEALAQMSMDKKRSKAEENRTRLADLKALFK